MDADINAKLNAILAELENIKREQARAKKRDEEIEKFVKMIWQNQR